MASEIEYREYPLPKGGTESSVDVAIQHAVGETMFLRTGAKTGRMVSTAAASDYLRDLNQELYVLVVDGQNEVIKQTTVYGKALREKSNARAYVLVVRDAIKSKSILIRKDDPRLMAPDDRVKTLGEDELKEYVRNKYV